MRWISGGIVAEKNSVCRVIGSSLQIRSISGNEAHVEHPVCFIDHQDLDAMQHQLAALDMIEQAAWRRDDNIGAAIDLGVLFLE